jgi:hypothetical protein
VLWAGSVGQNTSPHQMEIKVYHSGDGGQSWSYLSNCVNTTNPGGLWEPQFNIASDGALVCHWSDEPALTMALPGRTSPTPSPATFRQIARVWRSSHCCRAEPIS